MPIKIPSGLPAEKTLEEENIFTINNQPISATKTTTDKRNSGETRSSSINVIQFFKLLDNTKLSKTCQT